jgi:hypothetical protein
MTFLRRAITRRWCSRLLAAAALSGFSRGTVAEAAGLERLSWSAEPAAGDVGRERRYRADAQILILSVPLVRWPNVGGGSAVWREADAAGGSDVRLLEFTGFSRPDHAAGLNRLGFIRELSRETTGGPGEFLYFGLMTASPEETAEQARKALHSNAKEAAYTAIDGHLAKGLAQTVVAQFSVPASWSVANRNELVQRAKAALMTASPRPPDFPIDGQTFRPFLHTLAAGLRQLSPGESRFTYAGRLYRLSLEKAADAKATADFRKRGLIAGTASAVRVTGKVQRAAGGKESHFRLWVEDGAARPVPLRIDYQARSFLRLVFEAQA